MERLAQEPSASARKLQADAREIVGLLLENITAAAEREGRPPKPEDASALIAPFLVAAYFAAKAAWHDETAGKATYVKMLREFADSIDPTPR